MKSVRETIDVDDSSMKLYTCQPEGNGPFPAVVVIQHQYGVDKFTEEMTERTAEAGFLAVTPDLYHRDGPDCKDDGPTRRGRARDVNIIKDVNATVDYLGKSKFVDGNRVAILGFCMGGRVAYLMAAASKDFKAAISWYGGSCFRPGVKRRRPSNARPRSIARFKVTSAKRIKIRRWRTWRKSLPN